MPNETPFLFNSNMEVRNVEQNYMCGAADPGRV